MAEATRPVRRRTKAATQKAAETSGDVQDQTQDLAPTEESGDEQGEPGREEDAKDGGRTLTGELREAVRDAAIEVLKPVLRKATTTAAKYAVTEGPGLVKNRVAPKIQDAGGAGEIARGLKERGGGVAEKVGGVASGVGGVAQKLGGKKEEGKQPSGTGRGRRLPVQEFIDVGVDIETAYDQYTQFEEWPKFMHRVERIEQRDDTTLMWHENIWGVRRSWEAEITAQDPCERIAWRSKGGTQTIGVVTFHKLSDRLTRIYVTMDFQPQGLFEKTASGMRISRRALKSDLMRLKAFIELENEPTGAWRGRIEEGEVVEDGQEAEGEDTEARARDEEDAEQFEDEEEPQASEDEEEFDEEKEEREEEPQASEDEDYEDEDEDQDEESEEPAKGRFTRDEASAEEGDEAEEAETPAAEETPTATRRRRRRTAAATNRSAG